MISGPAAEISESLAPLKEAGAKLVVPSQGEWCFPLPNDGGTCSKIWLNF